MAEDLLKTEQHFSLLEMQRKEVSGICEALFKNIYVFHIGPGPKM